MTIATVMVCPALDHSNHARLEIAGQLAERFGAGLVGVAAAQFAPPLYFTDGEQAQSLIEQGEAAIKARLARLEAEFRHAAHGRAAFVDWRCALDFPARFILGQSRCADIVVTGGDSPAVSDTFAFAGAKDLVMQIGRPLLVVPDRADWLDLRSVLIAWKDTAEARRAIADSLPLLRLAKEVTAAEILEEGDGATAVESHVDDVIDWLAHHGVSASKRIGANGREGGAVAALEEIASQVGAGLIVAGAYGHSRVRELILGGMTQHLLAQSTRCVLLSH